MNSIPNPSTLYFIVLTQDEWNDKQRSERKSEFSWNYDGKSKYNITDFDSKNIEEEENDEDEVGPSLDMFLQTNNPNKQSTITQKGFKRPILNELDDEPIITKNKPSIDDNDLDSIPLPSEPKKGAEIAPPPTYEYYGPNSRRHKVPEDFDILNEMQDAISKGFKNANSRNKLQQIRKDLDDE